MRKILLIFFIISALYSCDTINTKSRWQIISEKEKIEKATGLRNDTIFLGFVFGMSETEVTQKFQQLKTERKINTDNNNYEYKFSFQYPSESVATFQTEYFNDSLFRFSLVIEEEMQSTAELVQLNLVNMFLEKYGIPIKTESIFNEKEFDYIWIQGNRKIEIHYPFVGKVVVNYVDHIMADRKKAVEKEIEKKTKLQTINDI